MIKLEAINDGKGVKTIISLDGGAMNIVNEMAMCNAKALEALIDKYPHAQRTDIERAFTDMLREWTAIYLRQERQQKAEGQAQDNHTEA